MAMFLYISQVSNSSYIEYIKGTKKTQNISETPRSSLKPTHYEAKAHFKSNRYYFLFDMPTSVIRPEPNSQIAIGTGTWLNACPE